MHGNIYEIKPLLILYFFHLILFLHNQFQKNNHFRADKSFILYILIRINLKSFGDAHTSELYPSFQRYIQLTTAIHYPNAAAQIRISRCT